MTGCAVNLKVQCFVPGLSCTQFTVCYIIYVNMEGGAIYSKHKQTNHTLQGSISRCVSLRLLSSAFYFSPARLCHVITSLRDDSKSPAQHELSKGRMIRFRPIRLPGARQLSHTHTHTQAHTITLQQ